jgi:hypothetical protein
MVVLMVLRQGDPLSHLFLVIVIEAFSRILSKAMVGDYLSGFRVSIQNAAPLEISYFLQMIRLLCVMQVVIKILNLRVSIQNAARMRCCCIKKSGPIFSMATSPLCP